MRRTANRSPVIWGLGGLIALLVPTLIVLTNQYGSSLRPPLRFVPTPDQEHLFQMVRQVVPVKGDANLKLSYIPTPEPATGIIEVWHIEENKKTVYQLIVFRHDIACGTCRDILAAALYDVQADTLVQVLLLDPWEVRGKSVDTKEFLAQFVGRPAHTGMALGRDIDGISGATFSTTGLVERLNEAANWMAQHSTTGEVASSTVMSK